MFHPRSTMFQQPSRLIEDAWQQNYRFDVYFLNQRVNAYNAVYMFVGRSGALYIGEASDLHTRLANHERMPEAIRMGATELWVHNPSIFGPTRQEVERRLISTYSPPMNKHFNMFQ